MMDRLFVGLLAVTAFLAFGLIGSAFAQSSHNASGLSTAESNVTSSTGSGVLGAISGGTPGSSGFGSSVSGAASGGHSGAAGTNGGGHGHH
jgi:hypothetical protein